MRHIGTAGFSASLYEGFAAARNWPANWIAAAGLLLFIAGWTIHGALSFAGRPLHFDVLEAYAWGKEFQIGYDKHGPFWAWIAGIWFLLFPINNWSFILLQAISSAVGLLGAWRLAGLFAQGWTRHAATLLLLATPFYTVMAFRYNANTIFIPLWPWTLYYFVRSLDGMKMRYAILLGVLAAACILSKYYAVVLLASCGLSLFFHPNARKYMLSPLPWTAAAIFLALVLPHFIWELPNEVTPITYALNHTDKGWAFTLEHAGKFLFEFSLYFTGVLAIIAIARRISKNNKDDIVEHLPKTRLRFLAILVLGPLALTVLAAFIFQLKIDAVMVVGVFPLMPLFLLQFAPALSARRCFQLAGAVAILVTAISIPAAPIERIVIAKRNSGQIVEPRRELAAAATAIWRSEVREPLRYAGAEPDYAYAISFYGEDHPSSFIGLSYARSPWVTPEKLKKHGLLIACEHEDADCLSKAAGLLSGNWKRFQISVSRTVAKIHGANIAFDIFVMPPQSD
jgi:4-amino-4-deoxy-L-arabinose transferase-like glycosyltransferase